MLVLVPLVWGVIRKSEGLRFFGAPTVQELEEGREGWKERATRSQKS